jgi:hypothetical protein
LVQTSLSILAATSAKLPATPCTQLVNAMTTTTIIVVVVVVVPFLAGFILGAVVGNDPPQTDPGSFDEQENN